MELTLLEGSVADLCNTWWQALSGDELLSGISLGEFAKRKTALPSRPCTNREHGHPLTAACVLTQSQVVQWM